MMRGPISATVMQGVDAVLTARVRNVAGGYLKQSDLTNVRITVYDVTAGMAVVAGPLAPLVSAVVFDVLQPYDGVVWAEDRTGYNFKYRLAGAAALPEARDYRVDVVFSMVDTSRVVVQYDLSAEAVP